MWTELSDTAILNKLGTRLKASRISSGLKQQGCGVRRWSKYHRQDRKRAVCFALITNQCHENAWIA